MTKISTKDKLIETGIELIWRNSYGSVSVDEICRKAGVNKGSFYHYFKSKAELASAVLEFHFDSCRADFDEAFSPALSPQQRINNMIDLIVNKQEEVYAQYGQVCGCPFSALGSEIGAREDIVNTKVQEIFSSYDRYMLSVLRDLVEEGVLAEDQDLNVVLSALRSYIMGVKMMARVENSLETFRADVRFGVLRILGLPGDA